MDIGVFFVSACLIGLVPAFIARSKGRSFAGFWVYGALIFIAALPHALLMKAHPKKLEEAAIADGGRKCPYCAEIVKAEAKVCRYCQREIQTQKSLSTSELLDKYGISKDGEIYKFGGREFDSPSDALIYAKRLAAKKIKSDSIL